MLKLHVALQTRLSEIKSREEGQAMAEYGIILALIAVVVIGTVILLGNDIKGAFDAITDELTAVAD